ncbi:hypothetical protein [Maribacter sp. 2307ULW6-5]|uniref:hypothetical protein n=1 Tax=Maribacter sp. 2307ULW6-5 TaxID=3386275 RepID=UPI0039BD66CB
MRNAIWMVLPVLLSFMAANGQIKIGDNPQDLDPASVLELESSTRTLVITRVSTAQMEAITPRAGALVYNTDAACVHYYSGTAWVNLCEASGSELTNEPVLNLASTISVEARPEGYNLELLPNSVRSANILDGSINANDIQDNSIGQEKLGADSVGFEELRDNSVGTAELRDGTIRPNDFEATNVADQVLGTDENGVVSWRNVADLTSVNTDNTLTGTGSLAEPLALAAAIQAAIVANTEGLAAHLLADGDTEIGNEIQDAAEVEIAAIAGINGANVQRALEELQGSVANLNAGGGNTDEQELDTDDTPGQVSITNGNAITLNVDDADASPMNELQDLALTNNVLTITDNPTATAIDLATYLDNTDEQTADLVPVAALPINYTPLSPDVEGHLGGIDAALIAGGGGAVSADQQTITGVGSDVDPFKVALIGSPQIENSTILAEDLNNMGAQPNEVLKWNGTEWAPSPDEVGIGGTGITAGNGLVLNTNGNILDINVDDASLEISAASTLQVKDLGITTIKLGASSVTTDKIADGAITAAKLDDDVAGNGLARNAAGALQLIPGNAPDQVLKWDEVLGEWTLAVDATGGGAVVDLDPDDGLSDFDPVAGYDVQVDGTTIEINPTDQLQLRDGAITAAKLDDDVAGNGLARNAAGALQLIPGNAPDQVLKWDEVLGEWTLAVDATGGGGLVDLDPADGLSDFDPVAGYDVQVDGTTIEINPTDQLQLRDGAITAAKLDDDVAGNGLARNAAGALQLIPGNAPDQVLKWDEVLGEWTLAVDATGGGGLVDLDPADGLSDFDPVAGYDVQVDGTTIEINPTDQLQLRDGAITAAKLDDDVAGNGLARNAAGALQLIPGNAPDQVLKWDEVLGEWTLAVDATGGGAVVDLDPADGLSDFDPVAGYDVQVDGTTIEINPTDQLQLRDGAITAAKLDDDVAGNGLARNAAGALQLIPGSGPDQVLKWNDTSASWELTNASDLNSIANTNLNFTTNTRHNLNTFNLIFEGPGNIGIGEFGAIGNPPAPDNKLDVNGQIRARDGFAASPGTVGQPSYGFYTNGDTDTGMYRAGNNQIGFSTGGIAALLIDENQNITIPNGSVTVGANVVHPDYVFQKYFTDHSSINPNYQFRSLGEVEAYVRANHHLPGVKSAEEVKKEGVWNLSASNLQNLEKIEELFLHTIAQEKKITALETEKEALASQLQQMKKDIEALKKALQHGKSDEK